MGGIPTLRLVGRHIQGYTHPEASREVYTGIYTTLRLVGRDIHHTEASREAYTTP